MKDGIYRDIDIDDYHANNTHYSSTQLKKVKKSLSHFKHYQETEHEKKDYFDFGNAFELALLDPEVFKKEVAIKQTEYWVALALQEKPELSKPKASKKYRELEADFMRINKDKYIINDVGPQSFETIELMLSSCYKDSVIQKLIKNTDNQISLFWTDPETGLQLKTRPDVCKISKNVIVDVKTIEDGSPDSFYRQMANLDYPMQGCLQIKGAVESGLMPTVDLYIWLVVEKKPPYNATMYEFSPKDQEYCMDELEYTISRLKKGIDEDKFPGYSDRADNVHGIITAEIPLWYRTF